jgi:hypothetical protein
VLKRHSATPRKPANRSISGHFFAILRTARHPQEQRRMETPDNAAPLMDNPQFLEGLAKLEAPPAPASLLDDAQFLADLGKLEAPLAPRAAAKPRRQGPQFMMPDAEANPIVEAAQSPAMHPVMAVAGLVLMMSIGAAAAALVFHDRVGQIVSQWQSAGR